MLWTELKVQERKKTDEIFYRSLQSGVEAETSKLDRHLKLSDLHRL